MKGSLPLRRSIVVLLLLILLLGGFLAYWRSSQRGLPYQDSFAKGNANEWKAFGGTWELTDGAVRNDSDDRGAKLVTDLPTGATTPLRQMFLFLEAPEMQVW